MSTRSELIEQVAASIEALEGRIEDAEGVRQAGEQAVIQCAELGASESETAVFQAVVEEYQETLEVLGNLLERARTLLAQLVDGGGS